jgi:hypothetical protein
MKEKRGKLRSYYFNKLLLLAIDQGFFSMQDKYAMTWLDSTIVSVQIRIGDKDQIVETRNEGQVPIQLWGIYYAIEGTMASVDWE